MAKKNDEKTCWGCERIIVGDAKLGLCPDCLNKYGSPATAVVTIMALFVSKRFLVKNGRKIIETAAKVAKKIKI